MTNKEYAPKEKTIYVYKHEDEFEVCIRFKDVFFGERSSDVKPKWENILIRTCNNSMQFYEKFGVAPEDAPQLQKKWQPNATILYPIIKINK